jgi:hypothetical protein
MSDALTKAQVKMLRQAEQLTLFMPAVDAARGGDRVDLQLLYGLHLIQADSPGFRLTPDGEEILRRINAHGQQDTEQRH